MSGSDFEEGIYVISLYGCSRMSLEANGGQAVTNQFVGSKLQQWEIIKVVGQSYSIRNVGTQKYLGMKLGERVRDGYELVAVEHAFPWDVRKVGSRVDAALVFLYVPYTSYVIDIHRGGARAPAFLHEVHQNSQQQWLLSKGQRTFFAIETEQGWAFQNVASRLYLGLPTLAGTIPDGTQVASVDKAFTWIVLPSSIDTSEFKLWVPFTSYVIDQCGMEPQDHSPIELRPLRDRQLQWWRFEPVPEEESSGTSKSFTGAQEQKI
ncbi:hypothetical protein BKA70DRAFT_1435431 [Coprinopsis sp. MPI-PUGE-AT-0042]|nr:hypothetical protein BKA70DRAFT_1435431 [Coprinopsis sp. MPI-PUGE-AT-0042]